MVGLVNTDRDKPLWFFSPEISSDITRQTFFHVEHMAHGGFLLLPGRLPARAVQIFSTAI
jgi:hypothetical protein